MLPSTDHSQPTSLCLEVIAWNGQPPHEASSCVIEQRGGSLGRADENDLVLADHEGVVSRVHALIEYDDGDYFLVDKSTNGTYVKDGKQRLEGGVRYLLIDGEQLLIGAYAIGVRLVASAELAADQGLPAGEQRLIDMDQEQAPADPFAAAEDSLPPLEELDGWSSEARRPEWFPEGAEEPVSEEQEAPAEPAEQPRPPVLQQHMPAPCGAVPEDHAPAPAEPPGAARVPTGYVPFADQFDDFPPSIFPEDALAQSEDAQASQAPQPPVEPPAAAPPGAAAVSESVSTQPVAPAGIAGQGDAASPTAAPPSDAQLLADFLRGLDLPAVQPTAQQAPEFMQQMGQLVHESVQGLIDILRLRAEFKHEFYVPATSIGPIANNLYKYSVNAADAMSRLLSDTGQDAYLGASESTRQAFQDLAAHQLALVAGMEAAVAALLDRFSPTALEEGIGKATMLEGVLPQVRRARMWEAFEKEYKNIADQAAEDFQEILGQHFARAYTQQIQRLEKAGFGGNSPDNEQS